MHRQDLVLRSYYFSNCGLGCGQGIAQGGGHGGAHFFAQQPLKTTAPAIKTNNVATFIKSPP